MINRLIAVPVLILTLSVSPLAFSDDYANDQSQNANAQFPHCMHGVFQKLNLTPDQTAKIKDLKGQMKAGLQDARQKMQSLHSQIKTLVQSDKMDESKLDELVNQKKDLIGTMMKNKIMMRFNINHLLTPQQKTQFRTMVEGCEQIMVKQMEGADDAG